MPRRARWRRRVGKDCCNRRRDGSAERGWPRDQLKQRDAERPEVGARVDAPQASELLGRHVDGRTHGLQRPREPSVDLVGNLRDAEVENLDDRSVGRLAQEKVCRLQVAVNDAEQMRLLIAMHACRM